jgi:carbon monoxide dehydrogenase subunit G
MELKGQYTLQAARDAVWTALNDPDVLANCLPGCETIEKLSDTEMKAVVAVEFGPFKSRFTGTIALSDGNPPQRWTLKGEGRGRPSGTAKGDASVELVESGRETTVNFIGSAEVGGKLADVVDSLVETQAREMADAFFGRLASELSAKPAAEWVDELDHSPAGVQLGDEPSEDVVEDKAENAGEVAEEIEEELEVAAGQEVLGGPFVWGLLALIVLIIILVVLY